MGAGRRALLMRKPTRSPRSGGLEGRGGTRKAGQTPLVGNQVVTMWATKTTTASTSPAAVDAFIDALKSPELTAILAETGLKRPPGFPSP